MARFYLGEDESGRDLYGDGKYPYADLRGKIPSNPQPNQGTVYKGSGVVWHWNGPKVVHKDLDQLAIDARYHMRPDAFGPGATPNGIQYEWAIGHDGTKYRLRNPGASLWHCGNARHNAGSFAATFLIGEGQRITAAASESARELTDALLRIQGLGRGACYGHRDVNPSTCPGTAYADFVLPYRAGKLAPAPTKPAPGVLYRVRCGSFSVRENADALAVRLKKAGYGALAIPEGGAFNVYAGSFSVRENAERLVAQLRSKGFDAVVIQAGGDAPKPSEPKWLVNWRKAKTYAQTLNSRKPKYWCWDGGSLSRKVGGRPACVDGPPPPVEGVTQLFCGDLVTLGLRACGKPVPKNGIYPGGTRSFKLAYGSKMVPFRLHEFREGDVAFVDFQERGPDFEGHIGVTLGDGPDARILQSFAWNCRDLEPGLNADYTLRQSHDGGYYTHRLPREVIWG